MYVSIKTVDWIQTPAKAEFILATCTTLGGRPCLISWVLESTALGRPSLKSWVLGVVQKGAHLIAWVLELVQH